MENILKLIYLLATLFKLVFFKKDEYRLPFILKEKNGTKMWYYTFKRYDLSSSAEGMCEILDWVANGRNEVVLVCKPRNEKDESLNGYYELIKQKHEYNGYKKYVFFDEDGKRRSIRVCYVTLFAFGRIPKYIYAKSEIPYSE